MPGTVEKSIRALDPVIVQQPEPKEGPKGFNMTIHQGPLPDPGTLKEYDSVVRGSARVIFNAFERQVDHRIRLEGKNLNANIIKSYIGMESAFLIVMTAMLCGTWIILHGKSAEGLAVVTGSLVALAAVFITGRYLEKKERSERYRQVAGEQQ